MDHRVVVSNQSGGSNMLRDYRKGNWTVQETMVLIEAKKMDDERRSMRVSSSNNERGSNVKPGGELRWKWVEDYCWKNGCLRSQNQCNDKWDNLMRDFKKVREYEKRVVNERDSNNVQEMLLKSYWKMERSERKEKNLPTNMLPEIYEALVEVVDRKCQKTLLVSPISTSLTSSLSPTLQQQHVQPQIAPLSLPPPPSSTLPLLPPPASTSPLSPQPVASRQPAAQPSNLPYNTLPVPTMYDSSDPDRSHDDEQHSDSPAKRRKKGGEGTSGNASGTTNNLQEVGSAIYKSAAIIAETIQASEEREERRHREIVNLHERRLQIEESKAEINRQGINGLVDSINRLANSILSLAANNHPPPK